MGYRRVTILFTIKYSFYINLKNRNKIKFNNGLRSEIRSYKKGIASNREIDCHGETSNYFVLTTHQQQEIYINHVNLVYH